VTGNVATAHPSVAPLVFILTTNDALVARAFDGVAAGDHWKQPTPQSNTMLWILGHMVTARNGLLALLGERMDTGLGEAFARGAERQESSTYPPADRIFDASRRVNERLYQALVGLTDETLSRPATRAFTPAVHTLLDQLAFLTMHDTYHVGQLGYARKALGYSNVAG
jgi:uncharacterized damage-inducible protein DinB